MFKDLKDKLSTVFGPRYWLNIISLWIAVIFLYFSILVTNGISFIMLIISVIILLINFRALRVQKKKQ